jgi:hypothetical protein
MSDKMDKGAIERFAISARNKLRHSVELKMTGLGANPSHPMKVDVVGSYVIITDPNSGIETRLTSQEDGWRNKLLVAISQNGYDNIVESVAYTWFNRLIAIRYMEVNNYIPSRVRVLSSIVPDKKEPDIVSQCLSVRLNFTNSEKEEIARLNDEERSDELFAKLFLIQCRDLNKILPELFTITRPYENMLFDISYTDPNGVVRDLVDNIPEEDFRDAVQIIGWMYQYYNTELKDDTFAKLKKNVKISKDRIPSATQLFTPDWIVRYMVENSVGRTWLDGHPNDNLKSNWKYYLDEAQQTPEVEAELSKMRKEKADMSPEDITVIDPCMGSGHILVYAFDVLIQIYESYGYSKEDAAVKIVEKNLYGLDIDDRAYQLAYFAVMMKARQYNSRIFDNPVKNHIFALVESDIITEEVFTGFGNNLSAKDKSKALSEIDYLVRMFRHAKTLGSLIKIKELDWDLIRLFANDHGPSLSYTTDVADTFNTIVETAKCLSSTYSAVVTNPPYMGALSMDVILGDYIKNNYSESKADLYGCFILRCSLLIDSTSYLSMITQQSWMFQSTFESLRKKMSHGSLVNMVHLGSHAFDEIGGEVVQTTAFVYTAKIKNYESTFIRAVDGKSEEEKRILFTKKNGIITKKIEDLEKIPGLIIAYWVEPYTISLFEKHDVIGNYAALKVGISTGNNSKYVRYWFEVNSTKISFPTQYRKDSNYYLNWKWFPFNNGGKTRRWYGNNFEVINWENDGKEIKDSGKASIRNKDYYLLNGATWTDISTGRIGVRYFDYSHIFSTVGLCAFSDNYLKYLMGLLNSSVCSYFLEILCPTLHFNIGDISKIPFIIDNKEQVEELVDINISLAKKDWDENEYSWDYQKHPLIHTAGLLEDSMYVLEQEIDNRRKKMIENEKLLDSIFAHSYGYNEFLKESDVDSLITLTVYDKGKQIRSLISYAVGCMFGRYSLDTPGLCYAGGVWDSSKYNSFIPDSDNIIPINDEEYFGDDIVTYFEKFMETVFGKETLEENLKYIVNTLEIKGSGTVRDKIRKYFLNDFYKDHVQLYQKCPIYWLFDSGKANGFKALIYIHRYTPDLIGKMRQNYLLKMQRIYDEQYGKERDQVRRTAIRNKLDEIERYDLAMELYASKNVEIDLDDGVKHNYALFQGIENSKSSKDRIDLLYRI